MNFKTFLLLLLIGICAAFIYLKVQVLGDENSSFNLSTRYQVGKYRMARNLLGMHKDGDARLEFLQGSSPVVVEIVQDKQHAIPDAALSGFISHVREYTGRDVQLYNVDTFDGSAVKLEDMDELIDSYRRHVYWGQPNLFVVYAGDFNGKPEEVGETFREYGIIVSASKLEDLTSSFPSSFPEFVQSTLLHEFGHQLGLPHNDRPECVMNASVEEPSGALAFGDSQTPVNFCPFELEQLQATRVKFK